LRIVIRKDDFTEVWDGVLYKKLSDYPNITPWELRNLAEFIAYEAQYGRECTIECEDAQLLHRIEVALRNPAAYLSVLRPKIIRECTACPVRKGCMTDLVCHTASPEDARSILSCGKLLSAVRARGRSAAELKAEPRNAANDPEDYFHYVMLAWGNCQAGDRLVMERKLGHFPDEEDLSTRFTPGVRFYFRYETLAAHPDATFDGVLPMKVRDEIMLRDYVHAIVIPEALRNEMEPCVPPELADKVLYIENDCADIWEWAEKVYQTVRIFSADTIS